MSTTRIRFSGLILGLLALAVVVAASTLPTVRTDAADLKDSKLKQLLTAKLVVLQEMQTQADEGFKRGEIDPQKAYEVRIAVYRARLDLCATDQERIAVLEELLREVQRQEKLLTNLPEISSLETKQSEVDRLNIEIERIKSK